MKMIFSHFVVAGLALGAVFSMPRPAHAHCDTMSGPVIADAKKALDTGNIDLVLKWVPPQDEAEIKKAFEQTRAVRKQSAEAKTLADNYFFETLVRVHRAAEGAPYTGLKPEEEKVDPAIAMADEALENGSADPLLSAMTGEVSAGIRDRFNKAAEAKKHMNESVKAGREYVEAYVDYTHYIEKLHLAAAGKVPSHGKEQPGSTKELPH
jgi:hypothetical protein